MTGSFDARGGTAPAPPPAAYANQEPEGAPVRVLIDIQRDRPVLSRSWPWSAVVRLDHQLDDGRLRIALADNVQTLELRVVQALDALAAELPDRRLSALWTLGLSPGAWSDLAGRSGLGTWARDPRTFVNHDDSAGARLPLAPSTWGLA